MFPADPHAPVGLALEEAFRDSVEDWLRYHRKGKDVEDVLSNDMLEVRIEAHIKRSTRGLIVVSMFPRRRFDEATYPYELRASPFSAYQRSIRG